MKRFYLMLLALLAFSSSVLVGTVSAASTDPIIINGHKFVDLGLPSGLLWAETNVGASSATDDGDYFSWGETKPKASYFPYDYSAVNEITSQNDAATINWGKKCRMPSSSEFEELCNQCSWAWKTDSVGTSGYLVTGVNGNSIFLPASGYRYNDSEPASHGSLGLYASSSSGTEEYASYLTFKPIAVFPSLFNSRYQGVPIRAVSGKDTTSTKNTDTLIITSDTITTNDHKFVDLGLPSGLYWAETNIGASTATEDGDYFAWGELDSKLNYSWPTYKWGKNPSKYTESDGFTVLESEDDVATAKWSSFCRMPSSVEMQELYDECEWTWTNDTLDASGYLVTGPNGNTIFLPASGYRCYNYDNLTNHGTNGYYWASTALTRTDYYSDSMVFDSDRVYPSSHYRYNGFTVRAVVDKQEATGITTIKRYTVGKEIQRYDISGRVISSPQKGINIIRYSDGTTKKVIIK